MEIDKKNYNTARYDLIFIIAFTVLNIIMAVAGGDTYMLFSAYIPYTFVITGVYMSGRAPEEFYNEYFEIIGEQYPVFGDFALYFTLIVAVIIIGVYLLMWFLSKKHYGFLVAATVLFGIDTFMVLLDIGAGLITDIIFHVIIIVMLVRGCIAGKRFTEAEKQLAYMQNVGVSQPEGQFDQPQNGENPYFQSEQGYTTFDPQSYQNSDDNPDNKNE